MVKTKRMERYEAKVDGDISKIRTDRYEKIQKENFAGAVGRQVAIEEQVRGILARCSVPVILYHYYMNFAKKLNRIDAGESAIEINKWTGRGLNWFVLCRIMNFMYGRVAEQRSESLVSNLMLNVPFYEMAGKFARDRSGYKRDGVNSNPVWTAGKIGGGTQFTGVGNYWECGTFGVSDYTLELWFYRTPTISFQEFLVSKGDAFDFDVQSWVDNNGNVVVAHKAVDASTQGFAANTLIPLNEWTHVAFVFKKDDKFYIYKNGELAGSGITFGSASKPPRESLRFWQLGRCTGSFNASCKIDEVRVWNRALSAGEINELYELTR